MKLVAQKAWISIDLRSEMMTFFFNKIIIIDKKYIVCFCLPDFISSYSAASLSGGARWPAGLTQIQMCSFTGLHSCDLQVCVCGIVRHFGLSVRRVIQL